MREIELEVHYSEFSWASSPYIFAQSGDDATINIHGTDESTEVLDRGSRLEWSEMGWLLPIDDSINGTLSIEGEELIISYPRSIPNQSGLMFHNRGFRRHGGYVLRRERNHGL